MKKDGEGRGKTKERKKKKTGKVCGFYVPLREKKLHRKAILTVIEEKKSS